MTPMKHRNTNMLCALSVVLVGLTLPTKGAPMFNTPFANFDGMVKREPWKANPGVPPQPVDWQKILTLKEPYFVVGKQTISHIAPAPNGPARDIHTLGVMPIKSDAYNITSGPAHPGLEIVEFFPLAAAKGTGGEMNIMPAILSFQDAEGKAIAAVNDLDKRAWRPDLQTEYFRVGNATLVQEIANYDNIFCLLYTSPSPRDRTRSRMPSSA